MLEVCNQMKLMNFNVYSHIMIPAAQKQRQKKADRAANNQHEKVRGRHCTDTIGRQEKILNERIPKSS